MMALAGSWLVVATLFTWVTLFRLGRRRALPPPALRAKVLLLRPFDEPTEREVKNLSEPLAPGVRQVVLAAFRPPSAVRGEWLFSDPPGANRKAGHLSYALASLGRAGEVVVCADADVRVTEALLASLIAPVQGGAALCTAAPAPEGAVDAAGHALRGLLSRTHHAFVALDAMAAGAPAVCGKAMALGPAAIDELPRLVNCIGEDLELSRRLHARGHRVELADAVARTPAASQTLGAAVQRITRWMQVLRAHRPALYPSIPLVFAPTIPLVLFAAWSGSPVLLGLAAGLFLSRTALSVRLSGLSVSASWEWLAGEALLLVAFVHSLVLRDIVWRGRRLAVSAGGLIRVVT
ncbi:MAG: glycosyltransferase [Archangium sp.]|nr:glycosyltransferase [Archangium sp.]